MKGKNIKRWLSVTAIVLLMAVTATACRPSPILEDIIYTDDTGELEPDHEATEDAEDGQEGGIIAEKEEEDSGAREDKEAAGKADSEGSTDIAAKEVEVAGSAETNAVSDDSAGAGIGQDEGNGNSGWGDGSSDHSNVSGGGFEDGQGVGETDPDNGSGTSDTDQEDPDQNPDDTQQGDNVSVPSKAHVPKKVVTGGNGEEQLIPEDVHTVTAVGPAAAMVEMLGGEGRLLGTSESFTKNSMAQTLFSDIDEINTWWADTGEGSISDEDFNELLQESPDVCFEISGQNTFSEEQVARLQELGIGYLPLPELDSTDNLKEAVTIIANALETNESNGKSAKTIASNYKDWVDRIMDEVEESKDKSVQYYTLYIKDYRKDISFSFEAAADKQNDPSIIPDHVSNTGVAVIDSPNQDSIFAECLEIGGIKLPGRFVTATINSVDYYQSIDTKNYINFDANVEKDVLIHPFYGLYGQTSYSGNTSGYIYPAAWSGYGTIFRQGKTTVGVVDNAHWYLSYTALGNSRAPVLLVANEEIKEDIENDFYWQFHGIVLTHNSNISGEGYWDYWVGKYPDKPWLYDTDYAKRVKTLTDERGISFVMSDAGGGFFADDFLSSGVDFAENTTLSKYILSGIWDNYEICVSPTGIDSWAEGGLETPLEAYWAANKISGTVSDSSLLNRVRSFYKTFFGITLSDTQLKEIIG